MKYREVQGPKELLYEYSAPHIATDVPTSELPFQGPIPQPLLSLQSQAQQVPGEFHFSQGVQHNDPEGFEPARKASID